MSEFGGLRKHDTKRPQHALKCGRIISVLLVATTDTDEDDEEEEERFRMKMGPAGTPFWLFPLIVEGQVN